MQTDPMKQIVIRGQFRFQLFIIDHDTDVLFLILSSKLTLLASSVPSECVLL